jgi:hypothetical protein
VGAAVILLAAAPAHAELSATCDGVEVSADIHDYNDAITAIQECAAATNGEGKIAISMDITAFLSLSNDYIPELTNYYSLARVGNGDATAGFFTQLCAYSEGISCTRSSGSPVVAPRGGRKLAQAPRNTFTPRTGTFASPRAAAPRAAAPTDEATTVYSDASVIQQDFAGIINGDLRLSADTTFDLVSTSDELAIVVDGILG